MRPDIVELDAFYGRLQGQYARRLINLELRKLWPDTTGQRILGLGYPGPFLQLFDEAERRIVMMPATQGAARWPADGANAATLAREDELPFADGSFDRVLLAHALECSPHANRLMREVWRVLADGGLVIALVPNRRGLWCWSEKTPFGYGQPYSAGQLERTLRNHLFAVTDERAALMMPPFRHNLMRRLTVPGERVGLQLLPQLAGLLIIEARKEIYAGTPAVDHVRPSSRRYVPILEGVAANRAHPRDPRPHGGGPHDERSRPNARPPPKFAGLPPHGGAIDETLRPIDRAPAF